MKTNLFWVKLFKMNILPRCSQGAQFYKWSWQHCFYNCSMYHFCQDCNPAYAPAPVFSWVWILNVKAELMCDSAHFLQHLKPGTTKSKPITLRAAETWSKSMPKQTVWLHKLQHSISVMMFCYCFHGQTLFKGNYSKLSGWYLCWPWKNLIPWEWNKPSYLKQSTFVTGVCKIP